MKRQDFRFFHRLRVRWAEVDMQKIVFNAHYLMYFDTAITDYWRALALPYEEAMVHLGGDLYVKKASVEYHGSARFDDRVDVALKCARIGNSSMAFTGAIFRDDERLITCELVYVFADPSSQTSKPVPDALRRVLTAYEAGEAMLQIRTGDWAALGADASKVRTAVFVKEQGIPMEMEWDEADNTAVHAVAYNGLGQGIATGRLVTQADGVGKIGRMAVHRVLRGSRVGGDILNTLMAVARERGDREVMLYAQRSAEGFYQRLGFAPRGEPFEEVGIPHIEMVKTP
ncbi:MULTISPECIES: YbgC/FadM family acyl-CoA thioesterase [unclassified Polaromonas]|uniref:YbgC/FadM family acyl-CoA thioesterase n=1 Tax=unclassified Polaromonas TaxID=2638319 RepID=UPI000F08F19F|nr:MULTISPECIES: YbgC/FadM family acyl-CoA thioesterase [unclassified Polaromonas]AYQ29547.1 GNAT family N-acetyltransferase [Polaromonas sp. SP1]QGJ19337.1 YbgC/FadM family acyl-CoA thioesterase [Polaromonas sp. Pch-P]